MSWYVYIAQARTGRFYTGISPDPLRRIKDHNLGKGSQFAKDQGPFQLVYSSQLFETKSEARKREIQIKKWTRAKKSRLISGEWQ